MKAQRIKTEGYTRDGLYLLLKEMYGDKVQLGTVSCSKDGFYSWDYYLHRVKIGHLNGKTLKGWYSFGLQFI